MNNYKLKINENINSINKVNDKINTMNRISQINRQAILLKNKKIKESINFFIITMFLMIGYVFVLSNLLSKYLYWFIVFIVYLIFFIYLYYVFNYSIYNIYTTSFSNVFNKFGFEVVDDLDKLGNDIFCE